MRRALPPSTGTEGDRRRPTHGLITFPTAEDARQRIFDLGALELGDGIKDVFAFAIAHHPIPLAYATQRHYWYAITTFARFAQEHGLSTACDLSTECINRYRAWLDQQTSEPTGRPWSGMYRGKKVIMLKVLVRTVKTLRPKLLPNEIVFPTYCYPEGTRQGGKQRRHLTRGELKSLLWACQQDIKENEHRFKLGQRVLEGTQDETIPGMRHALLTARTLIQTHGIASSNRLLDEGIRQRLINKLGGSEGIRSHLGATARTLAPILVSLMVQLAGNVDPIRKMKTTCRHDAGINDRLVVIEWHKPRAGPAQEGMQRRFADRTKRYGAPALIAIALTMTAPVRQCARPEERDRLFICEIGNEPRKRYGLMTYLVLKRAASHFLDDARTRIARWNTSHPDRKRKQIGPFDLRDIRGSVASEHYTASGGNIRSAQRALNHRHPNTTRNYIEGAKTKATNLQILDEVIRTMTQRHTRGASEQTTQARNGSGTERKQTKGATADFTHECTAPEREDGQLCRHFQQCLDCPGLVIPKTAEQLSRLLQAEETFREARDRLHPQRWEWLYAKSYATLTRDILPEFPSAMVPEARTLMGALPPLPDLE